jgi:aminoglycoside phosphotransferase (APT) family kinase protein
MTLDALPAEVLAALEPVRRLTQPSQGATSTVVVAETASGNMAVKYAQGALYGSWLAQEYRVLTVLATMTMSMPIPKPHALVRRDTGITPERWLVMDALPGRPLAEVLDAEHDAATRSALLRAFGSTLAAIHAAPVPSGIARFTPSWLDHMLEEATENLEHFAVDGTPELLAHLRSTPPAPMAPTLIHGDYTLDNVLVEDGRVTGIIDWAGGAAGDPRYDLALAIRPQGAAFRERRANDVQSFFRGYGSAPLRQDDYEYFNGLYEFF